MSANFAAAKAAATRLLLQQRLSSLRFDVPQLRYNKEILFDSLQHFCAVTCFTVAELAAGSDCLRDGCTLAFPGSNGLRYLILHNEEAPHPRRRGFTLAHEVGHIYLEHLSDGAEQEQEANCFAAQLLAPEILVYNIVQRSRSRVTPEELCAVFGVSRQAAANRLEDLARFPYPCFSEDDLALLAKFHHLLPRPGEPIVDI